MSEFIQKLTGFEIGSNHPIDSRIILTKDDMRSDVENMPDVYFAICEDDGKIYLFNSENEIRPDTGKFREAHEDILKDLEIIAPLDSEGNLTRSASNEDLIRKIESVNNDISNEITRAADAERVLQYSINEESNRAKDEEYLIRSDLISEINRSKGVEDEIKVLLSSESDIRSNMDNILALSIENEKNRAEESEEDIKGMMSDFDEKIEAEALARSNADDLLSSKSETISGDLSKEIRNRELAISSVNNSLAQEKSDRESSDSSLLIKINNESTSRETRDDELSSSIISTNNNLESHTNNNIVHITDAERNRWNQSTGEGHYHDNKDLLDTYNQSNSDIEDAIIKRHTHPNKELLDTYDQLNSDIKGSIDLMHEHPNKEELNKIDTGDVDKWNNKQEKISQGEAILIDGSNRINVFYDDRTLRLYLNRLNVKDVDLHVGLLSEIVPPEASIDNKLVDLKRLTDAISSNLGKFVGNFNNVSELPTSGVSINDYAFVTEPDGSYNRYRYTGTQWLFEYKISNTTFTTDQLAAINSKITEAIVNNILNHLANGTIHVTNDDKSTWNNKQDRLVAGDNIIIGTDNKVSAIDTKYTGADGIVVDSLNTIRHENSISAGEVGSGNNFVKLKYDKNGHIISAEEGSGISVDRGISLLDGKIGHEKSITSQSVKKLEKISFDAYGHISDVEEVGFNRGLDIVENNVGHINSVDEKLVSGLSKITYDEYGHITSSKDIGADKGINIVDDKIVHATEYTENTNIKLRKFNNDKYGHISATQDIDLIDSANEFPFTRDDALATGKAIFNEFSRYKAIKIEKNEWVDDLFNTEPCFSVTKSITEARSGKHPVMTFLPSSVSKMEQEADVFNSIIKFQENNGNIKIWIASKPTIDITVQITGY